MARVAVIGVGGWGKNHARVMHELGALAAVCDADGVIAGDFMTQEVRIDGGESTTIPRRQFQEPLLAELKGFVDFVDGRAETPAVLAQDATNVTKVAEAAIKSCSTGQPISLDL